MGNHCACLTNESKDGEFENMTDAQNMRVYYIIKIQSAMRCYLAQRKVNKIRNPAKKALMADHNAPRVVIGMLGDGNDAVDNLFPNSLVKVPASLSSLFRKSTIKWDHSFIKTTSSLPDGLCNVSLCC